MTFCNKDLFLSQSRTNGNTAAIILATTLNMGSQTADGFNWVSPSDNNTTNVQTITL